MLTCTDDTRAGETLVDGDRMDNPDMLAGAVRQAFELAKSQLRCCDKMDDGWMDGYER